MRIKNQQNSQKGNFSSGFGTLQSSKCTMIRKFIAKDYQPKLIYLHHGALFESKKALIFFDSCKWHATDEYLVRIKRQRNFKPITPSMTLLQICKHINIRLQTSVQQILKWRGQWERNLVYLQKNDEANLLWQNCENCAMGKSVVVRDFTYT